MRYNGQIAQDYFVSKVLKGKRDGYFLEIGSNNPIDINNTYILEKEYNWKGIMIEYEWSFLEHYKRERPNSYYIIDDATRIDYESALTQYNFPLEIDYLQIDLEVENRSTLTTLELFDKEVFPKRKFAVVTFEHDIYRGDYFNTREISREIFKKHGYYCVYPDIGSASVQGLGGPAYHFEDWYVHPDLVDMDYIKSIQREGVHDVQQLKYLW